MLNFWNSLFSQQDLYKVWFGSANGSQPGVSACLPQVVSSFVVPIAASLSLGQGVFVPGLLQPRLSIAGGSHHTATLWGVLVVSDTDLLRQNLGKKDLSLFSIHKIPQVCSEGFRIGRWQLLKISAVFR